jgi:hypothetical protein
MTEKFTFDLNGNLTPNDIIDVTRQDIQENFVDCFSDSKTRAILFETLLTYIDDLSILLQHQPFEMLIDGSFVTRKMNPNDIDLVIFIDISLLKKIETRALNKFRCSPMQRKLIDYEKIDAYIVEKYPEGHRKYAVFISEYTSWLFFFTKDRKGNKKGILRFINAVAT